MSLRAMGSFGALCLCLLAFPVLASDDKAILPVDSSSELEARLAALFRDALGLQSSLTVVGDDPGDLRVQLVFRADPETAIPRVIALVDTRVTERNNSGQAMAQAVNIVAFADIAIMRQEEPELLR